MQIFAYAIINKVSYNEIDSRNNACYVMLIIYTKFQDSYILLALSWQCKLNSKVKKKNESYRAAILFI